MGTRSTPGDEAVARALVKVLGKSRWEAVGLAKGYLSLLSGAPVEAAAKSVSKSGASTISDAAKFLSGIRRHGFARQLRRRKKTGSAENPVTKLFPAKVTELRFYELLTQLKSRSPILTVLDDTKQHELWDFVIEQGGSRLPINVKNAGTRFVKAAGFVGLDPEDSLPIPAYKAYAAVEKAPNLVYAIAIDYTLLSRLTSILTKSLNPHERIVWDLLNQKTGKYITEAEDIFVDAIAKKYWVKIVASITDSPFRCISAKKAIRILQKEPKRTPGIGMKAWGTGARAEVNVHVSVSRETVAWMDVAERIVGDGVESIVAAISRTTNESVFDPEI